jgi:hypothetical protein
VVLISCYDKKHTLWDFKKFKVPNILFGFVGDGFALSNPASHIHPDGYGVIRVSDPSCLFALFQSGCPCS